MCSSFALFERGAVAPWEKTLSRNTISWLQILKAPWHAFSLSSHNRDRESDRVHSLLSFFMTGKPAIFVFVLRSSEAHNHGVLLRVSEP